MAIEFRSLSPLRELGYPLERLAIYSQRNQGDVMVVAHGFYLGPEFLVLEKSTAFLDEVATSSAAEDGDARGLRDRLIDDKTLVREGARYVFKRDYVFQSSSLAASVILGRAADGPEEWRLWDWTKLAERYVPA